MKISFPKREYLKEWHDYFVWWPKRIKDSDANRHFLVWLETVRCRRVYTKTGYCYWQYRLKY